ncbi:hypothetical protein GEMRC1_008625 [Eukaryota sp. GEM-RC1]
MDSISHFKKIVLHRSIFLPPHLLDDVKQSVSNAYNTDILKYQRRFDGVLITVNEVDILSHGTIIDDSAFCQFDTSAELIVFSPPQNGTLTGTVVYVADDHIALLVYGVFNASIPKSSLSLQHVFSKEDNCWYLADEVGSQEEHHYIAEGSIVTFGIERIHKDYNEFISIIGTLSFGDVIGDVEESELPLTVPMETPLQPVVQVVESVVDVVEPEMETVKKKKKVEKRQEW